MKRRQVERWELSDGNVLILQRTITGRYCVFICSPQIGVEPEFLGEQIGKDKALALAADTLEADVCDVF